MHWLTPRRYETGDDFVLSSITVICPYSCKPTRNNRSGLAKARSCPSLASSILSHPLESPTPFFCVSQMCTVLRTSQLNRQGTPLTLGYRRSNFTALSVSCFYIPLELGGSQCDVFRLLMVFIITLNLQRRLISMVIVQRLTT